MLPRKIWVCSTVLALVRFLVFLVIHANQSHDAQWQLAYLPLWIVDFPISIAYFACPIPWAEALIGPVWWFFLPIFIWRLVQAWKNRKK
jgi:hypothetical protein